MATTIFEQEKSVFFVMDGVGASWNDGGCTQAWWDAEVESIGAAAAMAKLMNVSTGAPIIDMSSVTYEQDDNTLTKANIHVGVEVGMIAYVEKDGGSGSVEAGRYKITAVSTNRITCDGIDGTDCTVAVVVGGAFEVLLDASDETDATDNSVTIYVQSTPILDDPVGVDSGGGSNTNNTFKRIVGFNTIPGDMSYGEAYYESPAKILQNGSIDSTKTVAIDADEQSGFGDSIVSVSVDNVIFENLHVCNLPDYPAIVFWGTPKNVVFRNCRFSGVVKVTSTAADNLLFDSCYTHDSLAVHQHVLPGDHNVLLNCVGNLKTGTNLVNFSGQSGAVIGCITVGGSFGIRTVSVDCSALVMSNTFYNTATYGVCLDTSSVFVFNNIFCLAPGAIALYPRSLGSISYNDYNCFIESDGTPLTVGGNESGGEIPVIGPHSIEVDPDFVDAANGDFRVRNPLLLRGGRPGPDGRAAVIGAIGQEYQFAERARVMNAGRAGIIR